MRGRVLAVFGPSIRRRLAAALLMAGTVMASASPPAHIHLASHDHDDHDHAAIEHSHWTPHHWTPHHASRAAFDDDDGRVLFVDHPALVRAAHGHAAYPETAVVAVLVPLESHTFTVSDRQLAGNAPRDGPPRDISTLRGPPFVL